MKGKYPSCLIISLALDSYSLIFCFSGRKRGERIENLLLANACTMLSSESVAETQFVGTTCVLCCWVVKWEVDYFGELRLVCNTEDWRLHKVVILNPVYFNHLESLKNVYRF